MLLDKLLWLTAIVAILYGAGTRAFPALERDSRFDFSLMMSQERIENIDEGFCVQPKPNTVKPMENDDTMDCGSGKSSLTMSHINRLMAFEEMLLSKDLNSLLELKREIESRIPQLETHKTQEK
ncbi:uncharacterized protein [Drosophila kikkawai]|uniref:Uncharacterized protein isoform X1 n=1 Tax=Drosophila kikkawai TaxID=30033 RepID=A0A6P4I2V1_DROKI|nr:uncharacterized protein LOC108070885 [Drosophila kikkawai]